MDLYDTASRTYDNDPATWLVGLLDTEETCSTALGITQCRRTHLEHDDKGEVWSAVVGDPADPGTKLTLGFAHDAFGNVTFTTADDEFGHHRSSCVTYDAEHLFPFATGNSLFQITYAKFDPAFGVMTAAVDPNGLATRWQHDAFGGVTEEMRPDGTRTTVSAVRTKDGGPQAKWWNEKVTTAEDGGAVRTTELDSLGRPVHAWTVTAAVPSCGATVCDPVLELEQETSYDSLGRVWRTTVPWMTGDTLQGQQHHDYQYDAAGRLTKHTEPWGRVTTYGYGGNVASATDWLGTSSTEVDGLGRVVKTTDKKGYATGTIYGPFSLPRMVWRTGGDLTISERDAYGRVVHEVDQDRGLTDTTYDGFGEALTVDDALGRHYGLTYDALGRLRGRDDPDGTVAWEYDTAAHGVGRIAGVTSPESVKQYAYDALSRPAKTALMLTDTGETMQAGFEYDGQGRLQVLAYPQVAGVDPLVVRREYDGYGNLVGVVDNGSGKAYWRLAGLDGAGRPTVESMGSGVTAHRDYDSESGLVRNISLHNLSVPQQDTVLQDLAYTYDEGLRMTSRADLLQTGAKGVRTETFTHDALGRLTCSRFSDVSGSHPGGLKAAVPCALGIGYDALGNITSKSDVGVYGYAPAHPHAVTTAGAESFGYDAVGNQIVRPDATIAYTAFDLPSVVMPVSDEPMTRFTYDGDQRRIRKKSGAQETVYFEGLYERVSTGVVGATVHRYYVPAGSATVVLTRAVGGKDSVAYLHTDALGSTDVVTDGAGNVDGNAGERRSYDAFGARRNPVWGQAAPAGGFTSKASSMGFTGHEGDDELGLINMRGRIYDPRLGRFLTMDPVVSRPGFGQSWNPYSYVLNSPLNFTDPSGFDEVGTYENQGGVQGTFSVADVHRMFADPASGTAPVVAPPGTPTRVKDAGQDDTTVASEPPPVQLEAVRTDKVEKSVKGVLDTLTDTVKDSMCPLCALGNLLVSTGVAVKSTPGRRLVAGGVVNAVLGPAAAGLGVVQMGAAAKRAGDEGDYETAARLWTSVAVTGVSLLAGGVAGPEGAAEAESAALEAGGAAKPAYAEGSFSIVDWAEYPAGVPQPTGVFRLLNGLEYKAERTAADAANRQLHRADSSLKGMHIHEIKPVKFGGSPTDLSNKIVVTPAEHSGINAFWGALQRSLEGN